MTPLHAAIMHSDDEAEVLPVVQFLVGKGADVTLQAVLGWKAARLAFDKDFHKVHSLLM